MRGNQSWVILIWYVFQPGKPVCEGEPGGGSPSDSDLRRDQNAQVEDPYGRGQALQQDRHRQNQAGPDEDAAHPYFEGAKDEAQAGQDPARFRRRFQEGRAHDSLRLIAVPAPCKKLTESGVAGPRGSAPADGPRQTGSFLSVRCAERSRLERASEEVVA